ncbi:hypothetical protein B0T20DRAFT_352144 [Sordaria brevicollis]|uniref:Uncharacterized protein n=1 Tax=Sordaria brevicollis TaxID=83679 RepID=A0AAE0PFI3_SORBR|nr:hypothetical protein B0T20DRAFT_352144 [Sordaria brevicollis]
MVVLRTLAALAVTAAVSVANPLHASAKFSIPGPLAMNFGNKVVPQDTDVTLTALPPKLGTFKRLPGSSYTVATVHPYGILVDSMDSTLLWLQTGLKPAPVPSNFETSDGFYRVYELLNGSSPVFPWTPSNLQGPEHSSVLTLLFDTSNITPQDELYLQNAAMNPSRFNFVNAMGDTSLSDKVAAGALFLATSDATMKPSSAANVTFATLLDVLNMPQKDQAPMLYRRASETETSVHPQESDEVEVIIEETKPVTPVLPTQTVTTTVTPLSYYPMIVPTDCPDERSSASRNRMTVYGLVSVAAILFAI